MRASTKITAAAGFLLTTVGALPGVAAAEESSPFEYEQASTQSAVVYVQTTWSGRVFDTDKYTSGPRKGEPFGYVREKTFSVTTRCTGFVVNPDGHIATAGHCVERTDDINDSIAVQGALWQYEDFDMKERGWTRREYLAEYLSGYRVDGVERQGRPDRLVQTGLGISLSGESSKSVEPARVLDVNGFDNGDVALLKIEADNLPSLELAQEPEIGVGTEVTSVGYDASVDLVTDSSFNPLYEPGKISTIRTIDNGLLEVYAISSNMNGGMSGGPAINDQGQVVGLNSFGIRGEPQSSNFIRPVSIIQEMLLDHGVTNEIGAVQEAFLAGLDAYFAGDKTTAVEQFDQVLAQLPSHEIAQQYRAKAATLPDPVPAEDGGLPLLALGIAALLVIAAAVAGGVTLVVIKSRKGAPGIESPYTITLPEAAITEQFAPTAAAPTAQNGHRNCGGCGTQQLLGNRFCPECGAPAQPALVE